MKMELYAKYVSMQHVMILQQQHSNLLPMLVVYGYHISLLNTITLLVYLGFPFCIIYKWYKCTHLHIYWKIFHHWGIFGQMNWHFKSYVNGQILWILLVHIHWKMFHHWDIFNSIKSHGYTIFLKSIVWFYAFCLITLKKKVA
jgi:hypothetical protein